MPSLGADMKAATLVAWYMQPGDQVKRGDIIADVHTDKGDIDVEVFEDGVLEKTLVQPGEKLPVGTVLAYIRGEGEPSWDELQEPEPEGAKPGQPPQNGNGKATEAIQLIGQARKAEPATPGDFSAADTEAAKRIRASPLARKIAAEKGIDLRQVHGSRPYGAIGRADVEHAIAALTAKTTGAGIEEPVPVSERSVGTFASGMRRAIAAAMSRANREIPHYYLETHIDMQTPLDWLSRENRQRPVKDRLLPSALYVKALAHALSEVPQLNGYWQNDQLQVQEPIHIGMAIALRQGGLVIPSIHHADMLSLDDIMKNILDLTQRVRSGRLRSSELSDATTTLTSLGERGVETVYGVVYPPQVALVGLGKITDAVRVSQGMLGIRPVLHATLAADHRATDGHLGALFLEAFTHYLQDTQTFNQ